MHLGESNTKRRKQARRRKRIFQAPSQGRRGTDPDSRAVLRVVARLMKEKGISYVDLAALTNTHPTTMHALLHPSNSGYGPLHLSTIRMIAEALGVDIQSLLYELKGRH